MILKLIAFCVLALLLISGCSSKKYFNPKNIISFTKDKKSLNSPILFFNKDGATLRNGTVISKQGISKIKLEKGFVFLNNSEAGIIASNNQDELLVGEQSVALDSIVVSASMKDDILALVHHDNSISLYDLKSNTTIFKEYFSKSYINDVKIANPYFVSNLILFPTLDGKLIIVSSKNYKIIKSINIDSSGKFNNITYLNVVNDTLIAASANKIVSIGKGQVNIKSFEIRDIISHDSDIYIATIDGQLIKIDINLNILNKKKFKFAKIYSLAFGASLYALESQGYLIEVSKDFKEDKVYDFSFNESDKVISIGDTLYIDDIYIKFQ